MPTKQEIQEAKKIQEALEAHQALEAKEALAIQEALDKAIVATRKAHPSIEAWQIDATGAAIVNSKGKLVKDQESILAIPSGKVFVKDATGKDTAIPGEYLAVVTGKRSTGDFKDVLVIVLAESASMEDLRQWYVLHPGKQKTKTALSPDQKILASALRQASTDYANDTRTALADEVSVIASKNAKDAKAIQDAEFQRKLALLVAEYTPKA